MRLLDHLLGCDVMLLSTGCRGDHHLWLFSSTGKSTAKQSAGFNGFLASVEFEFCPVVAFLGKTKINSN